MVNRNNDLPLSTASSIIECLKAQRDENQREVLMRFFKTGRGEYGYGDEFLGLKVPQTRAVAKRSVSIPLSEIAILLRSQWHEVRLCGLLIMVLQFEKLSSIKLLNDENAIRRRDGIVRMYLKNAKRVNNWDLVDLSAPKIIGRWLLIPSHIDDKRGVIDDLAHSEHLWLQRISMVCTWYPTHKGDASWCLRYAEIHINHTHDLMHKAVGWMLREMGKCVDMGLLRNFLKQYAHRMPRTTLRYAIERMSDEERREWMRH